jgi:hypothetical protein
LIQFNIITIFKQFYCHLLDFSVVIRSSLEDLIRVKRFMTRQLLVMALGLIFLIFPTGMTHAQTDSTVNGWVTSNLPRGVTIQSATAAQLAAAVKAAIKAHPKQAKAIVAYVFSQFTDADRAKALAVIDAIIGSVPADEVAGLIKVAIESLSLTIHPQTGLSAQSALASMIAQEAIAIDPGLVSEIFAAFGAALPGPGTQLLGPGGVTNPANFSNTSGSVNSPQ